MTYSVLKVPLNPN